MKGRKIYFNKSDGHFILDTGETNNPLAIKTTIEEDINRWKELSELNRDTFDVLELPYGAYALDFAEGRLIGVNAETKVPIFEYPNPSEPIVELVPFSTQIQSIKVDTEMALLALTDVYEKQITDNASHEEDAITSMIGLTEAYEMIMMQSDIITQLESRLATLEEA